jgi:hypothetical protein
MARNLRGEYVQVTLGTPPRAVGAYVYSANSQGAEWFGYYAGEFWIDTGIDDPTPGANVQGAEIWGARVYSRTGYLRGGLVNGAPAGIWRIKATPCWSAQHYVNGVGQYKARVWIHCEVYFVNPPATGDGWWYALGEVDWTLYRL